MDQQSVDLEALIAHILLRYDPLNLVYEGEPSYTYADEAKEILRRLRRSTAMTFLDTRDTTVHVLAEEGIPDEIGHDRARAAAEEIWQAWSFYGLQ